MAGLRFQWEPYLTYGRLISYPKHTPIYRQGETGNGFYYLNQGGVNIIILSENGQERTVDHIAAGTLFGEHGVNASPYLTTAVTTIPSIVHHYSDQAFARLCREHPEAAAVFTTSLIDKFRWLAELIAIHDSPIEHQAAHYLFKLVQDLECSHIPINQTSLARYIGTSRITIHKIIQKWQKQGWLDYSSRCKVQIKDMDKLKAIVKRC